MKKPIPPVGDLVAVALTAADWADSKLAEAGFVERELRNVAESLSFVDA